MRRLMSLILLASMEMAGAAGAAEPLRPGVVFDTDKFDKSFNEAAYTGLKRFEMETRIPFLERVASLKDSDAVLERSLRDVIGHGANLVVTVGFAFNHAVERVARENPEIRFAVIDSAINLPNVSSILFSEHEVSFLVGMMAALATRTGTIGFIGGTDMPVIQRFECGFTQGARHARPDVVVLRDMVAAGFEGFNDAGRARELAHTQIERGADVVFAAAGRSGLGALDEAAGAGRLAIGVDANQNYLHPGSILTSALKRVDVATYLALKSAQEGTWRPGIKILGLKDGALSVAMDEHNALLVTDDMLARVEEARDGIIANVIAVHSLKKGGTCSTPAP